MALSPTPGNLQPSPLAKDNVQQDIKDASAPVNDRQKLAQFWQIEMTSSVRLHKEWHLRGDKIIDRYMDERNETSDRDLIKPQRRMNILWSNVETLKPTLLAKAPVPNVSRANKDKDPVGRWAAIVLERCLSAQLRDDRTLNSLKAACSDLLLPGRGVVFESYRAELETADEDDPQKKPGETITEQGTCTEYVHWKDFFTNRARNWNEVWYVTKQAFLTRKELHRKYDAVIGAAKVNLIPLDHKPEGTAKGKVDDEQFAKATVYQIWDKNAGKVVEIAKEWKEDILNEFDPPVEFDDFFPCPRPLFATMGGKSLIPTPDYAEYQDQAEEIDLMTHRIHGLTKALKLRGIYDASNAGLAQLFNDAGENELVPVESFALFAEKGGIAGAMVWVPIKEVAAALIECMRARDDAKKAMYEVTGISDIVRGASVASETATAQQLKSQWGSIRIRERQQDCERVARDVLRLKATIIATQFTQQTLMAMSNVKLLTRQEKAAVVQWQAMMQARQQQAQPGQPAPPPQPLPPPPVSEEKMAMLKEPVWEDVVALLRNEQLRNFVIDVETDSTIEPDQEAQRQQRTAFVTAVTQFTQAAGQVVMASPAMAPLMGELLVFAVRGWKVGEQMETQIEDAVAEIEKAAAAPKPPSPQMLVDQAKAEAQHASAMADQSKAQNDNLRLTSENAHKQAQTQLESKKLDQESAFRAQELEMQRKDMELRDQQHMETILHAKALQAQKERHDRNMARINGTGETDGGAQASIDAMPNGENDLVKALDQQSQAIQQLGQSLAQGLAQMGAAFQQGLEQLARHMSAPQEIVRHPETGRVVGSRKVLN